VGSIEAPSAVNVSTGPTQDPLTDVVVVAPTMIVVDEQAAVAKAKGASRKPPTVRFIPEP
jgi:hypothetical protein